MKTRNLEGTNNDLSNIISSILNDNELEEYEMTQFFSILDNRISFNPESFRQTQFFSILDNRISFNPESFRQFILNGNGDLFIIIMHKLIDDVGNCVVNE